MHGVGQVDASARWVMLHTCRVDGRMGKVVAAMFRLASMIASGDRWGGYFFSF